MEEEIKDYEVQNQQEVSEDISIPQNNGLAVTESISRFTILIAKYPAAFVGALFGVMFLINHYIANRRYEEEIVQWRKLYIKEKEENDKLQNELLIKAGIIQRLKKEDDVIKDKTEDTVKEVLKLDQ